MDNLYLFFFLFDSRTIILYILISHIGQTVEQKEEEKAFRDKRFLYLIAQLDVRACLRLVFLTTVHNQCVF